MFNTTTIYFEFQNKQEIFFVKGALEKILPQCTKYYENGQVYSLSQKKDHEFLTEAYDIGQQGLRGIIRNFRSLKYIID
jgi:Ca2+-transporting ATPase